MADYIASLGKTTLFKTLDVYAVHLQMLRAKKIGLRQHLHAMLVHIGLRDFLRGYATLPFHSKARSSL